VGMNHLPKALVRTTELRRVSSEEVNNAGAHIGKMRRSIWPAAIFIEAARHFGRQLADTLFAFETLIGVGDFQSGAFIILRLASLAVAHKPCRLKHPDLLSRLGAIDFRGEILDRSGLHQLPVKLIIA